MNNTQYTIRLLLGVFDWLGTVPYTNLSQSEIATLQQKRNDLRTVLEEGHPDISTAMAIRGIQDTAPSDQIKKPLNLYCVYHNDFVALTLQKKRLLFLSITVTMTVVMNMMYI